MKQEINLLEGSPKRLYLRYLLPSISATLVTSIYILADTILIGQGVGEEGIAALNIILPIFSLFFGSGLLFGIGGAVLMSIAFGQEKIEKGRRFFTCSVIAAAVLSVIYLILFNLFFEPIVRLLGATNELMEMVTQYGRVLVCAAPVFLFSALLQAFVRNDRAPETAMKAVIAGGVTNVVLDYIFIFPLQMGIRGAIIATVIGTTLTICILTSHFFNKANNLKLVRSGWSTSMFLQIIKNGFASLLIELSNGIMVFLFNIQLIRYIGEIGVTVYGIISNSALVALSLANGVAQAAQPIIAANYGGGRKERVAVVSKIGIILSAFIGFIMMLCGEIGPAFITSLFVKPTDEILLLSVPAVRIYFLSFAVMTVNVFISNYFQSVMQPEMSLFLCILRGILLGSILVFLLPVILGVKGIWMVMPIVEVTTLAAAFVLIQFRKKTLI